MCQDGCAPNAPDSFASYSAAIRRQLSPAIVVPMIDYHPPDDIDDGAYLGNVGVFEEGLPAIVAPSGPWFPDYGGIVPISVQQEIISPEPWMSDDWAN